MGGVEIGATRNVIRVTCISIAAPPIRKSSERNWLRGGQTVIISAAKLQQVAVPRGRSPRCLRTGRSMAYRLLLRTNGDRLRRVYSNWRPGERITWRCAVGIVGYKRTHDDKFHAEKKTSRLDCTIAWKQFCYYLILTCVFIRTTLC